MSLKLSEVKNLHGKGLALIYLRPKEKRPFESGWTTQKPKTLEELELSFEKTYNLGVRLGAPSKIGKHYLACIDVDIKQPGGKKPALEKLKEITQGLTFPTVLSGSGGGSRHLYCVTAKPFKMITVEKNKAWEICIYSNGRQMVLPPSIHPDTGFQYVWAAPWNIKDLPLLDVSKWREEASIVGAVGKTISDFKAEDVDLYDSKLPLSLVQLIVDGTSSVDRSSEALSAAMSMCRLGFSDNQILSVLSNSKYFISGAALDRKNGDRKKAIEWLKKYVLEKARYQTDIARRFDNPPSKDERKPVSAKCAAKINKAIEEDIQDDLIANGYYLAGPKGAKKPDYEALLKEFAKQYPYKMVADMKHVYAFNGTHYTDMLQFEIKAFAERLLKPKPEEKMRMEFMNKVYANNVVRRNFFLESTEGKINFKNGVLCLDWEKELLPHSPEYGFRGVLPYEYNPKAKCPLFKEWLRDVMMQDKELERTLQEFMGYIVRGGDYKYHKALWLGGEGRNGKSTFIDVLKALIGIGNFSVISIKSLMGDKFAGSDLDGKIANFSEETSPEELADSGPFKNLTGDGDIFAQKKYGDPYAFRNKAKLVMTYNRIPDLKDLSPGMLSRPLIVPFKKIIAEHQQDRSIKEKLFKELPGIFNFAMRGWDRLERQGGFTEAGASKDALQKVKEESCNAYQWVENHIRLARNRKNKIRAHQLYLAYSTSERYAYKEIEFHRRINAHPFMRGCKKKDKDGKFYKNIEII